MKNIKKIAALAVAIAACFTPNTGIYREKQASALTIIAHVTEVSAVKNIIAVDESITLELTWSTGAKQELIFTSSDESVAVVDANGVVTGIADGTAVISVTCGKHQSNKTLEITVSSELTPSAYYNTSELTIGQKLKKYDTIHYDKVSGVANVINSKGDYDLAFISEKDYVLPYDMEVVSNQYSTLYLAPELDDVTYLDGRTLNEGDIIPRDVHLLCYDYEINNLFFPVFLPSYHEQYIGEGVTKVKAIDHEKKTITVEAVQIKPLTGDANGDGVFGLADMVTLNKWLLGKSELASWQNADLCKDDRIDVFDLVAMRKVLIESMMPEKSVSDADVK